MADEPIMLPMVPEPQLTPEERSALSEAMLDPAFWEEFRKMPEPGSVRDVLRRAVRCINSRTYGLPWQRYPWLPDGR